MLAVLGVDNPAIEAAFAAVPREHFLGPPPWTASSPFGGSRPLPARPGHALPGSGHRARSGARRQQRPPVAARQTARGARPKPGEHIVHIGAGAGYYSAILAELVGSSGQVTAVEFDAALAERARTFLSGRSNVRIVHSDGARWPETSADGVYVNFAVARPADRWIEGLAAGGRLVFPLGVPGPQRPDSGGRHSDRGAALRIERRGDGLCGAGGQHGLFCLRRGRIRG